jgi:hypothetical protein
VAYLSTPAFRFSTGKLIPAEKLTNFLSVFRRAHHTISKVAKLLGGLAFEEVTPSGLPTFHLALAGYLEALGGTPMCFLLRHLSSSLAGCLVGIP